MHMFKFHTRSIVFDAPKCSINTARCNLKISWHSGTLQSEECLQLRQSFGILSELPAVAPKFRKSFGINPNVLIVSEKGPLSSFKVLEIRKNA